MGTIDYGAQRELLVVARGHPYARDALAALFDGLAGWRWSLGVQPAAVKVHTQMAGGAFGLRAIPTSDYVVEACQVANA